MARTKARQLLELAGGKVEDLLHDELQIFGAILDRGAHHSELEGAGLLGSGTDFRHVASRCRRHYVEDLARDMFDRCLRVSLEGVGILGFPFVDHRLDLLCRLGPEVVLDPLPGFFHRGREVRVHLADPDLVTIGHFPDERRPQVGGEETLPDVPAGVHVQHREPAIVAKVQHPLGLPLPPDDLQPRRIAGASVLYVREVHLRGLSRDERRGIEPDALNRDRHVSVVPEVGGEDFDQVLRGLVRLEGPEVRNWFRDDQFDTAMGCGNHHLVGEADLLQVVEDYGDGVTAELASTGIVGDVPVGDPAEDRYLVASPSLRCRGVRGRNRCVLADVSSCRRV